MMMKTANALLEEPLDYVAPPRGCAIYLAESDYRTAACRSALGVSKGAGYRHAVQR
jgi:hypothetical protein